MYTKSEYLEVKHMFYGKSIKNINDDYLDNLFKACALLLRIPYT